MGFPVPNQMKVWKPGHSSTRPPITAAVRPRDELMGGVPSPCSHLAGGRVAHVGVRVLRVGRRHRAHHQHCFCVLLRRAMGARARAHGSECACAHGSGSAHAWAGSATSHRGWTLLQRQHSAAATLGHSLETRRDRAAKGTAIITGSAHGELTRASTRRQFTRLRVPGWLARGAHVRMCAAHPPSRS